jgi:addiction module RelB/DinJ family antitoxin
MTTLINFKTEESVKSEAQELASRMGLNLSDVLNIFLRKFIKDKEIHISIEEPSAFLIKEIKEANEEIKKGNVSPAFNNASDAVKWLRSKKRKYANKV